jgi:hypothetical protein
LVTGSNLAFIHHLICQLFCMTRPDLTVSHGYPLEEHFVTISRTTKSPLQQQVVAASAHSRQVCCGCPGAAWSNLPWHCLANLKTTTSHHFSPTARQQQKQQHTGLWCIFSMGCLAQAQILF